MESVDCIDLVKAILGNIMVYSEKTWEIHNILKTIQFSKGTRTGLEPKMCLEFYKRLKEIGYKVNMREVKEMVKTINKIIMQTVTKK